MSIWVDVRELCAAAFKLIAAWRWRILVGVLLFAAMAVFTVPRDAAWVEAMRRSPSRWAIELADWLSVWGDYPRGTIILFIVLLVVGLVLRRPSIRRAAIACILAASISGLTAITLRTLVGRPRPRSPLPDGIYGPNLDYRLNSFPSGHSASAFGTAIALLPTIPVVGIPCTVIAGGVAWSRLHRNHHHFTDVVAGGAIGSLFGLAFGVAAKRRSKLQPRNH